MTNHINALDQLESRIAIAGSTGTDPQLRQIAELLIRRGILPTIAGILADADAPEPVRMRALARASQALRSAPATHDLALMAS